MTFQESLGVLHRKRHHETVVGVRQIKALEVRFLLDSCDHHQRFAEIRLCISRRMRQRHEHLFVLQPRLAHVILHDRVAAAVATLPKLAQQYPRVPDSRLESLIQIWLE